MNTAAAPVSPYAIPLYPTVCYRRVHPELLAVNKDLAQIVMQQEREERSLVQGVSIKGGYHSDVKFFEKQIPAVQALKKVIFDDFADYIGAFWKSESNSPIEKSQPLRTLMWGWSVILREGGFSTPHLHVRSTISGVYYVQTPEDTDLMTGPQAKAGWLNLMDPRVRAYVNTIPGQFRNVTFPPQPGSLVMFPSHMEHFVPPFMGKGARISIAFNVRLVNDNVEM